MHLTLVPYIATAGELKTKPTQHSVQKLREIGIFPTALMCRADRPIPDDERAKISLFANVREEAVISMWDVDSIYKIPQMLQPAGSGPYRVRRTWAEPAAGRSGGMGQTGHGAGKSACMRSRSAWSANMSI